MTIRIQKFTLRKKYVNYFIYILLVLTLGFLRVVKRYFKEKYLYFTSYMVFSLEDADAVEINDCLYDLEIISSSNNRYLEMFSHDGKLYFIKYKEHHLVYHEKVFQTPFIDKIDLFDPNEALEKDFYEDEYTEARKILFGKNIVHVKSISFYEIVEDVCLSLESLWSLFAIIVWFNCDYTFYAKFSSLILSISILYEIYVTYQNRPIITEPPIEDVQVFRNGEFRTMKSTDVLPYDIVSVLPTMSFFADGFIIRGTVLLSEAHLTGEDKPILRCKNEEIYSGSKIIDAGSDKARAVCMISNISSCTKKELLYQYINNKKGIDTIFYNEIKYTYKITSVVVAILIPICFMRLIYIGTAFKTSIFECLDVLLSFYNPSIISIFSSNVVKFKSICVDKEIVVNNGYMIKHAGLCDTVIFDKTGVLTHNVPVLYGVVTVENKLIKQTSDFEYLVQLTLMCCHAIQNNDSEGDEIDLAMFVPMEATIHSSDTDDDHKIVQGKDREKYKIIQNYTFNSYAARQTVVIENSEGETFILSKGSFKSMVSSPSEELLSTVTEYERLGFRILAMAASKRKAELIRENDEENLEFIGFVLFQDKTRTEAVPILEKLRQSGIGSKICTGDSLETAIHVASATDMVCESSIVRIDENDLLDLTKLNPHVSKFAINGNLFSLLIHEFNTKEDIVNDVIDNIVIIARCDPLQKQEVVKCYKNRGCKVMFVGDGENDLVALSEANVSVSFSNSALMTASHFSTSNFCSIYDLLKIGRTSISSMYASFQYCVFSTVLISFILFFCLLFKASPSDKSCVFIDITTFYILPFVLNLDIKISDFTKITSLPDISNLTICFLIEAFVYSFVFGFFLLLLNNDICYSNMSISLQSKEGTLGFFIGFYLVIFSFAFHTNIGKVGLNIFDSSLMIKFFGLLVTIYLIFVGLFFMNSDFFNNFMGFTFSQQMDRVLFFICILSIMLLSLLSSFIYQKSNFVKRFILLN